jgi:hypothetical protein
MVTVSLSWTLQNGMSVTSATNVTYRMPEVAVNSDGLI